MANLRMTLLDLLNKSEQGADPNFLRDGVQLLAQELMDAVAAYLQMPPVQVYEVATFYSMFETKPVGRIHVSVCTNISCMLCGSDEIVAAVHASWSGRTTKRGDVYYNYKKLVDAGEAVRPWVLGAAVQLRTVAPKSFNLPKSQERDAARTPIRDDQRPRFLVTGCTPIQVGSERTELGIITSARAMVAALDALGFNVNWRKVTPGEDLTRYAGCLVYLQKFNSIACSYYTGALWTLLRRPDSIVGVDDIPASAKARLPAAPSTAGARRVRTEFKNARNSARSGSSWPTGRWRIE